MSKRKIITCIIFLLVIISFVLLFRNSVKLEEQIGQYQSIFSMDEDSETNENCQNAIIEPVVLVRVVDGDTVIVNTPSEKEVRVRLIGVNTPESVNPDASQNTPEGKAASEFTKSFLKVGSTYYLEYDKDQKDDYDRTLAYLWLVDCSNEEITKEYITENMFNAVLLSKGYAKTMKIAPNTKYASIFEKIQKENQ